MRKELMMNGVGIIAVIDNKFHITNDMPGYECYIEVDKNRFIEELKKLSWVCLTSWDIELRKQYLELVDYVNNMKEVK